MMYSVEDLLTHLKTNQKSLSELKKCHGFRKLSSSNPFGELVTVTCNFSNKEALKTELQQLIEENQRNPTKIPLVSFSINENKIYLKLDRLSTIKSVLKNISECKTKYGSSVKLFKKAFRLEYGQSQNELTVLRMRTAGNVVSGLVALGGGSVTDSADAETVYISPHPGSYILVGSVHVAESADSSQATYLQLRRTELQTSDHKGLSEQLLEQMVTATVVFDMLSVKLSKALVLNSSTVPPSARRSNCKGATFVLYNFARVCAILEKFELMVSKGTYKPLLSVDNIDFNLLLKEEEWRLVFDYLAEWPFVIAECQDLNQPKLHNIVAFLSSLASTFSVFYKYNRVLNEGLAHMLPLMEARMHLLKAIREIFLAAFSLLRINAPTKM